MLLSSFRDEAGTDKKWGLFTHAASCLQDLSSNSQISLFCSIYSGSPFASGPLSRCWYLSLKPYMDLEGLHTPIRTYRSTKVYFRVCASRALSSEAKLAGNLKKGIVSHGINTVQFPLQGDFICSPLILVFCQRVKRLFCFIWYSITNCPSCSIN